MDDLLFKSDTEYLCLSLTGADSVNFTVNENTGVISTNALLDRESQDSYAFTLTTTDSGGRFSLVAINVTVSDVNDNNPVCGASVYAGSVAENAAVGTSVITVECPDLDIGGNGEVSHLLMNLRKRTSPGERQRKEGGKTCVKSATVIVFEKRFPLTSPCLI